MSNLPKKHRGPGRPKGAKDIRPLLIGLLQKYRLYPVLMAEFEKAKASMTPKECFLFSLELAKLGIQASPKTLEGDGAGLVVNIFTSGIGQKTVQVGEAVDVTPLPEPPPPPASLPDRETLAIRERCYPTPSRPGRGIPEVSQSERDAAEAAARLEARQRDDEAFDRRIPVSPLPGAWDAPLKGPNLDLP